MENWRRHPLVFWVTSLPPTFWLVAFFLVPLAMVWVFSFSEKQGIIDLELTWTFDNYARAVEWIYLEILLKSFWMAGLTTLFCFILGFPVAFAISFAPAKWKPVLLLLVILPFWTNLLIRTYALIAVLRSRGYVNFTLEWFYDRIYWVVDGIGLGHLMNPRFTYLELLYNNTAVLFGMTYVFLPFMILPLYAALERMDRSYIEASLDLGASQVRTFRTVIIPLSKAGILSGIIITFIPALGSFLQPDLLGGPDSQLIGNVIERQFKSANDWPFGAALSFILMYLTFGALALRAVMERKNSRMEG
ncbi:MAG: ABC transporter permease [Limibacillus sp.]|jgi:spermidine/putrescine transport system permease protein